MPTDPIGEIPVEITGDYGPLEKAFEAAKALAEQWAGKIADGFNSGLHEISEGANEFSESLKEWIEHPLQQAAGALTGFVEEIGPLGVAATAAAGAIALIGKEVVDLVLEEGKAAEATSNLANRLNLSFEDTKKLGEMAQIAGVSIDSLARVSMRLADALDDPAGAGKKVAAALKDMDIVASDSGDALLQLLQKLAEIPDATERISKAHEVMGRSAIQLEPLLLNYRSLSDAVDELGGKLDSEAVAGLKAADDAADKLSIVWAHMKEGLAATFAPAVTAGLDMLTHLLTSAPPDSLEKQIAQLTMEIYDMSEAAKEGTPAVASFFAAATGMGGMDNSAELIQRKQMALDELESRKQAIERSKEYNAELDKSNAAQKAAAAAAKIEMAEMVKAEEAFHNSVVDLYNTFPDTYNQYTNKLKEGGKDASESLKAVEAQLEKAKSLSSGLTGQPLTDLNEWITALTKMRDTAKQFAETDAFFKAATKISSLTDKFPEQVTELSMLDSGLKDFFLDMEAAAAVAPKGLEKFDIAQITQKMLEGQKQLDDAVHKTGEDMEKAMLGYDKAAEKASKSQTVITTDLKNRLSPALQEAYRGSLDLVGAFTRLGIVADKSGTTMSQSMKDFESIATSSKTNLDQVEQAWGRVSGEISTIAHNNLPLAVKLTDEYIAKLISVGAAAGQIYDIEAKSLQIQINYMAQRGADATAQIEQLENVRLKIESLNIATHALGDVYVGLNESFLKVFDNLDKGLTKLITSGGSITDTLKSVGKSLEQDIVGTFVHGITEGLKKSFIDSGVGQAVSGFLTKIFGDVFGGLFKAATQAPGVVAQTANTTALSANTAAVTALTSALGAQSAASAAAGGIPGGSGGGAAGGAGIGSTVNMISGAITAISSVLQFLQGRRMEQDIGRMEVTTRGMLNQLISIQGTLNDYLPGINHLVDVWAEIMVTNDILRLMAQNGGGLGSGTNNGADPDFGQKIADAINDHPSGGSPTGGGRSRAGTGGVQSLLDGLAAMSQSVDGSTEASDTFRAGLQTTTDAAADVSEGLQTAASTAYRMDEAVGSTTDSLLALNDVTKEIHGSLPAFADFMDKAVFNSMAGQQGKPGQNLTPGGAHSNISDFIMPVPTPDALTGPGGFMQGAMLPHVNNPIQYGSIAPVVGGPGVARGGEQPLVNIYAVDPNGRQLANATQKGLEEIGIRTR